MQPDVSSFAEPVSRVLAEHGHRLLPLTRSGKCFEAEVAELRETPERTLFPDAREGRGALAGLILLLGCWDQAHDVAQAIESSDGSFWHGILHRMEPSSWNSNYWFGRVGEHPVFPSLLAAARRILDQNPGTGWVLPASWNPPIFTKWCVEAREAPGTDREQVATAIQKAEWELLFNWCASKSA